MDRILLVEDDLSLIDGLSYSLEKNKFQLTIARTVKEAISFYEDNRFDLLLLDLTLPDGSGFDICKFVRQRSNVPIIFLTASDYEVNVVMGLDMGGDDYITKPFKLNELISRIHALLRRSRTLWKAQKLSSNGLVMDQSSNQVRRLSDESRLEFTALEFHLLCLFMKHPNMVLTREQILDQLWDGDGDYVDDNTLSVYICRLRNKIEENPSKPQMLLTIRGMGYQWKINKAGV